MNRHRLVTVVMILGALAAFLTMSRPLQAQSSSVVINEIMQNPNAVFDSAGEWFELYNAGGSDVDINGWTIADNGSDSHVIANGGPLLIPAGGYLVLGNNTDSSTNGGVPVAYSYGGSWFLSNGADEVVLFDTGGSEVDRVEYDGGATFPDPTGASMALIDPALDNNVGANWCEAATPYGDGDLGTPGAANDCAVATPEIVINEIMQNPDAVFDSAGEWFELYNAGGSDVDIDGWTIADNDFDSHVIANGGPLVVPAGGYLVLGNNTDSGTNGGVPVAYSYGSDWFLSNGADEVVLFDAGGSEVDRVEYDGGATFPDPTGASMALIDPALDNNVGANWCTATSPYGDGDLGTPGAANDCPVTTPQIVINEIMQNPAAVFDSAGEWFELYNAGGSDVDIDGWTIADNDIDSHVINNGGPLVVPAGGYLVLGNNTDSGTNGGAPVAYSYGGSWFLSNGADEVVLFDTGGSEVDRVEYDGGATFPDPTGASMALIDPALDNNDGANWCTATTPYGDGDLGTPGAANDCAGTTPEIVINEIMQNPNAVFDSNGEWFELYNAGGSDVDIDGWTIADNDFDSHVIANGGPLVIPAGGYLVLGNNADSGTNGGAPVAYSYGGSWFLSNGADEVVLFDTGGSEVDRVEYDGGPVFPDPNGASMTLIDPALDNNDGANWCTATSPYGDGDLGTPGAANYCGPAPVEAKIHEVQGSGSSVAITDPVIVRAIVVGDYQADGQLGGFFIQEEDADIDANADTSEGIFVFCGGCATDVAVGDLVRVTGLPGEYFGMSQLDATEAGGDVTFVSGGNTLPTAATIDLPASGDTTAEATFEAVEGMLVTFSDTLVVSEYFQLARYGQLVLTADARPRQFTDAYEPSVAGYTAYLEELNKTRIILDDDNNIQNDAIFVGPDEPYYWPRPGLSISNYVRGGDSISGLTGVMHWSYAGQSGTDAWRVRPVDTLDYSFTSNNERQAAPDDVGGTMQVASFNVLNFFTTLGSRGADSFAELDRQREKIAAAICAIDADVVGLMEIENNGSVALENLLNGPNGINANCGPYAYIDTGVIGTDAIVVAFIYKPATVSPVGGHAILDSSVDPRFNDDKNRPALAQTFEEDATGAAVTVVVNHLKSKGSDCEDVGDPDLGDGQGNCNLTRQAAAEAMVDWLAADPTGSGDSDVLIIGDLNSYRNEDPIDAIEEGADDATGTTDDYTDLLDALLGPSAYTYVFDGQLGYLDYGMANNSLLNEVTGVTAWHINADEIPVFDYNDAILDPSEASFERESSALPIYEPNAYRASDHDPVIVGLNLCTDETAPTLSVTVSPDVLWPPNHEYVDVTATVFVSDNSDPNPTVTLLSVTSNEPDNGDDDGNTVDDIVIVSDTEFKLRAERSGLGSGRVYTITYLATDACGNSTVETAEVVVPIRRAR